MNWYTRIISGRTATRTCTVVFITLAGLTMFQSSALAQAAKAHKAPEKSTRNKDLQNRLNTKRAEATISTQVEDKPIIISDGSLSILWVSDFDKWKRCPLADGGEDFLPPANNKLSGEQIYYDDEESYHQSICHDACTVSIQYGDSPDGSDTIVISVANGKLVKIHTKVAFHEPIKGPVRHWMSMAHPNDQLHISNVFVSVPGVLGSVFFPPPSSPGHIAALGIELSPGSSASMPVCPPTP